MGGRAIGAGLASWLAGWLAKHANQIIVVFAVVRHSLGVERSAFDFPF